MTDNHIIHRANGIRRIRECCKRAWLELNPIDFTLEVSDKRVVKIAGFTIEVDHDLSDNEFYFKF